MYSAFVMSNFILTNTCPATDIPSAGFVGVAISRDKI